MTYEEVILVNNRILWDQTNVLNKLGQKNKKYAYKNSVK